MTVDLSTVHTKEIYLDTMELAFNLLYASSN
jgi:hypothetical protein